jgi:hypothetical protein
MSFQISPARHLTTAPDLYADGLSYLRSAIFLHLSSCSTSLINLCNLFSATTGAEMYLAPLTSGSFFISFNIYENQKRNLEFKFYSSLHTSS